MLRRGANQEERIAAATISTTSTATTAPSFRRVAAENAKTPAITHFQEMGSERIDCENREKQANLVAVPAIPTRNKCLTVTGPKNRIVFVSDSCGISQELITINLAHRKNTRSRSETQNRLSRSRLGPELRKLRISNRPQTPCAYSIPAEFPSR